jgi:hypothetical protein
MQIIEDRRWIRLVRSTYRPAEYVALPGGGRAVRVGTGRSRQRLVGKIPAEADALLPEAVAKRLTPSELAEAERWLEARARERRAQECADAMRDVGQVMARAAEGYERAEGIPPETGRQIWRAWQSLRGALQRSGLSERECCRADDGPSQKRSRRKLSSPADPGA